MNYFIDPYVFHDDKGLIQKIAIHFNYFQPKNHDVWQDPFYGSIKIIKVLDASTRTTRHSLSVLDQIKIRNTCWKYLEKNLRFKTA